VTDAPPKRMIADVVGLKKIIKRTGGLLAFIAVAMGASYCSEAPKYRFGQIAVEVGDSIPGARLISSVKVLDPASPATWIWPVTVTWNFAVPDPVTTWHFYLISMRYEEKQPAIRLLDVDCHAHEAVWNDLDEPETALPAISVWGDPVVAPNGQTYRRSTAQPPLPEEWLHAFCETNWTAERKAVRARVKG
jgi:hypothetical protein